MENQNRPVSFFRFEDLRIYHKSLDYFNWILGQIKSDTPERKVVLKPLANAAMKISVNIAEGSARHRAHFINFLKDAKTAVRECVVLSSMAHKSGLFNDEQYEHSKDTLIEMTKMIGAMIVSLQRNTNRQEAETEQKQDFNNTDEIDFEY